MKCESCGRSNEPSARFCSGCGASLSGFQEGGGFGDRHHEEPRQFPPGTCHPTQSRTMPAAIASLCVAIVGFFAAPVVLGVVAVILGSVGINNSSKDPTLKGRNLARAGLLIGVIDILLALSCGLGIRLPFFPGLFRVHGW